MQTREFYTCEVLNELKITERNETLEIQNENHKNLKNNFDVEFFYVSMPSKVAFFPKLESTFPNLKQITLFHVELREIHRENLKPFVDLEILILSGNQLESLEENLFEFNGKLRACEEFLYLTNYI